LLLLFPLRLWTSPAGRRMLHVPATPFAATSPHTAAMWAFLEAAGTRLPAGAVVTVRAADPTSEMTLYMLATSLLRDVEVVPSSYYGHPLPAVGGRADLVLAWDDVPVPGSRLVERLDGGRLLRQGGG
jgi:hypothetical protein